MTMIGTSIAADDRLDTVTSKYGRSALGIRGSSTLTVILLVVHPAGGRCLCRADVRVFALDFEPSARFRYSRKLGCAALPSMCLGV